MSPETDQWKTYPYPTCSESLSKTRDQLRPHPKCGPPEQSPIEKEFWHQLKAPPDAGSTRDQTRPGQETTEPDPIWIQLDLGPGLVLGYLELRITSNVCVNKMCMCGHLIDVDLALGRSLQEGTGVPLAGQTDA